MTITELIAALEAADGPSRELDEAVLKASGWFTTDDDAPGYPDGTLLEWHAPDGTVWRERLPQPTSSIDAAVTLVPEGEEWAVICSRHKVGREGFLTNVAWVGLEQIDTAEPQGATPALALCIAALKAREAKE